MSGSFKALNISAAKIIEDVLAERITDIARFNAQVDALQLADKDSLVARELHQAGHFISDADVRKRDKVYDASQRKALAEAVANLKTAPA